jgi:hypothetical protein
MLNFASNSGGRNNRNIQIIVDETPWKAITLKPKIK